MGFGEPGYQFLIEMAHSPPSMPAMNSSAGGWRHGPSNGIDEHYDGFARVGQFSVKHFDREDHVVAAYQRSFAQGYHVRHLN